MRGNCELPRALVSTIFTCSHTLQCEWLRSADRTGETTLASTGRAGTGGATWIKAPLAIMAEGAGGGLVVSDGVIVELVAAGRTPVTRCAAIFDASRHVVIPGLVNTHHHMFQTLTRAHPAALNKSLWP